MHDNPYIAKLGDEYVKWRTESGFLSFSFSSSSSFFILFYLFIYLFIYFKVRNSTLILKPILSPHQFFILEFIIFYFIYEF